MPGVEDWINGPMSIIQRLFDGKTEGHYDRVKEFFSKKLEEKNATTWIPSLNSTALHHLQNNSLVRFRCMVQDTYDPEFYLGVYEVADLKTGDTTLHSGMFKDIAECRPQQEIKVDSTRNKTLDRQTLYCVPIPGESEWVKKGYCGVGQSNAVPSSSVPSNRCKRPLDDDDTMNGNMAPMEQADTGATGDESKKPKLEAQQEKSEKKQPDLNFPLPGEKGPACLVKIYDHNEVYKVNEMVEFIGVLSNDPAMASFKDPESTQSSFADPAAEAMETEEQSVHHPPPSLVPRLHVVHAHRLQHNNPLLPRDVNSEMAKTERLGVLNEASSIREEVLGLLQQLLFGDKLAAEYLLCHLISSVYARHDVVALGKFSLNLSGLPRNTEYAARLYRVLQQLLSKSYYLPLTLSRMNSSRLVPCKDYSANRLISGLLQLSDRTHLMLDETAMDAGQLDPTGVKNITALGNVISWQKVEYDFNFHKQDFHTNIICLVLSEGKSLLKCDCRQHLQPVENPADLDSHFKVIEERLTSGMLTKLRTYLGLVQLLEYEMPQDLQKEIEEDFVDLRKADPKNMSVDDFHSLLVFSRLMALTYGKSTLTKDIWERTKALEIQRKLRLSSL